MQTQTRSPLTAQQIDQFHQDGFLVVENLLSPELVEQVISRFEPLFSGEFETGVYPDEWHWNPHLGNPNAAGQLTGGWKCDRAIASVVTTAKMGAMAAALEGWSGARLLTDGLWRKPPGAKETTLHQDSMYINYHTPPGMVTCWIALSHAVVGASTIEYVKGSHRWALADAVPEFHNQDKSYRSDMDSAAKLAGIETPEVVQLNVAPGSGVFHHGNTWHGSGKNTMDVMRRSMVLAYVPAAASFKEFDAYVPGGYVPGKYRRHGDDTMDESFFPIVWREDGYRSPFLADYCGDALGV